ncbi:DUF2637 domain-containing protein [Nocardiopsis exhalans]|uniref:DUF2637 domain-containing protein n=1 Tax=Nocardiopsis exhalans TaxID=163604 RepID=UPI00263B84FA|nr:DUF2637 domain-containing protein [Nocardiopsis exhalans]
MTMAPFNNAPETGTRNGRTAGRGAGAGALVGGAVFVSVIALCALVIAYNGIYRFALLVHEEGGFLAHIFPVTFTLLVLMAFWVSYVLRAAPPRERLWVDVVLIPLLILAAAVPMVLNSMGLIERLGDDNARIVQVVVAVAPLAALLVAFLLWITVRAHIRKRNIQVRPRPKPSDDRPTVLRSRPETAESGVGAERVDEAPVRGSHEPEALKTRLLRLGADEDYDEHEPDERHGSARADEVEARTEAGGRVKPDGRAADEEDTLPEATPLPARTSTLRRDRAEQREKERLEREELERAARERDEHEQREREERADLERREREEREQRERAEREREETEVAEEEARLRAEAGPDDPTEVIPAARGAGAGTAESSGTGRSEEPEADLAEASVPTLPLPRRSRGGGNPIKRAAAEPPVVPGAAAPAPEPEPEPAPGPEHRAAAGSGSGSGAWGEGGADDAAGDGPVVVVPDHLADEGFEHEPPVADPATDEAEAPIPVPVAVAPEPEPVAVEADGTGDTDDTVELWPAGEAETDPLPEVEDLPRAEELTDSAVSERPGAAEAPEVPGAAVAASEPEDRPQTGAEPADTGGAGSEAGSLWEPPSEAESASPLADYVPPVWTPPEEDTPAADAAPLVGMGTGSAEDTTPALDHDTGPEVRAAFRFRTKRRGATGSKVESEPEQLPEPEPLPAQKEPAPEPEPEAAPEPEVQREPERDPKAPPEPVKAAKAPAPEPRPRKPLEKRPMILKPKRPPMPDFASGPPSRRVRSEPLPPDER